MGWHYDRDRKEWSYLGKFRDGSRDGGGPQMTGWGLLWLFVICGVLFIIFLMATGPIE